MSHLDHPRPNSVPAHQRSAPANLGGYEIKIGMTWVWTHNTIRRYATKCVALEINDVSSISLPCLALRIVLDSEETRRSQTTSSGLSIVENGTARSRKVGGAVHVWTWEKNPSHLYLLLSGSCSVLLAGV